MKVRYYLKYFIFLDDIIKMNNFVFLVLLYFMNSELNAAEPIELKSKKLNSLIKHLFVHLDENSKLFLI